jgi:hypothetical protein
MLLLTYSAAGRTLRRSLLRDSGRTLTALERMNYVKEKLHGGRFLLSFVK